MIDIKPLKDDDARFAMEHHEFDSVIIGSAKNVVIILSQTWCSQWEYLSTDLEKNAATKEIDLSVFYFLYNRSPLFQEFLSFKETVFQNAQIPYLRCYKDGALLRATNFMTVNDLIRLYKS